MIQAFALDIIRISQTNNQNLQSFLGLVLNLQKTAYLQYVSRTNQEPTLTTNSQKLKLH